MLLQTINAEKKFNCPLKTRLSLFNLLPNKMWFNYVLWTILLKRIELLCHLFFFFFFASFKCQCMKVVFNVFIIRFLFSSRFDSLLGSFLGIVSRATTTVLLPFLLSYPLEPSFILGEGILR